MIWAGAGGERLSRCSAVRVPGSKDLAGTGVPLERTLKDADLALRAAGGADLPLLATLSRRWHAAVDTGHGREDISAATLR